MRYTHAVADNDPKKAGELAGKKLLFGEYNRYAVFPVHTTSYEIEWHVADADTVTNAEIMAGVEPQVVQIGKSFHEAVKGIENN